MPCCIFTKKANNTTILHKTKKVILHLFFKNLWTISHMPFILEIHLHQYTHSLQSIPFSIGCYVKFSKIFTTGYVVTIKPQPNWVLMDASDTPFRNFQV